MRNQYLLHGKLTAKSGHQDDLSLILLEASKLLSSAKGCKLYVVGKEENDKSSIYITEIWDSKTDHESSLQIEGVKELIMKAIPILEKQPEKGQEIELLGGIELG